MIVILHLDPAAPAHLLGIWAPPLSAGGPPRPYYPDGSAAAEPLAAERVAEHGARRTWAQLASYLAGMSPYTVWCEYVEVPDTDDLPALYQQLSSEIFAYHAANDGSVIEFGDLTLTSAMLTAADKALLAADTPARKIAMRLGLPDRPPARTTGRLSTLLTYFDDEHRLLVVATDPAKPAAASLALARGLSQAGSRDLWLVVPDGHATPLLRRAAFIDRKIRIWTCDGTALAEQIIPSRAEILDALRSDSLAAGVPNLGERETWITALTQWASDAPGVVPGHRPSYLAWHCNGLMILKVAPASAGQLRVTAGVHRKTPPPATIDLAGPIEPAAVHRVIASASAACAASLDGTDPAAPEHRLQAALNRRHLGLIAWEREFPARRPVSAGGVSALGGDSRGYIDFLGVDADHDLHIVETKIGPDETLVLQALDYWTWATAQKAALSAHFAVNLRRVIIDFVVAPSTPGASALSPYTAEQAEALSGDIGWRFWTIDDTTHPTPRKHPSRVVPAGAPRRCPPRFRPWLRIVQTHLAEQAESEGRRLAQGVFYGQIADGLLPAAASAAQGLTAAGLDHKMLHHVRSSQAFALNLFAGLDEPGRCALLAEIGVTATRCPPPTFEWSDPLDRLHEATAASPHKTQVDVMFRPESPDGRHIVLIEVKLSETDFGHCSAYASTRNPDRNPCRQPHPFGGDPAACFQLRNHDNGPPRRYLDALGTFSETPAGTGCWFRLGNSQVMRNVALARTLIQAGEADTVTVALCAPLAHRAIWRRWAEARAALHGVTGVTLSQLPADVVATHLPLTDGLEVARRYLLDIDAVHDAAATRSWQQWADEVFPQGAAYVVEPPTWDEPHTHYVGQVFAAAHRGRLSISIVPVLHEQYNPTSWELDPNRLHIEYHDAGCRLRTSIEHNTWLVTPSIAPANPYIDDNYLREAVRNFTAPIVTWPGPWPLDDMPVTLGVGA